MTKIILFCLILILLPNGLFSQIVFTVNDFSKEYYGKISVEDTSKVFMKGSISIYDKKTGKQIIYVVSDELAFEHDGAVKSNIKELPYGKQSVIIYDDFNFDGIKDFAIEDGQNSGYHLPSFEIYLASGGKFIYNKSFSRLAQENTGMFDVDSQEKKINTMSKSGCCWH